MAQLSEEQKKAVAGWFASGASLDAIQKRMRAEFGIHLTYLDVRLMVAELPQPAEAEAPKAEEPPAVAEEPEEVEEEPSDPLDPLPPEAPEEGLPPPAEGESPAGSLEVAVDPLAPPGCIACGSVTFSDGTAGKWMLDQMGRLGLTGLPQGYRPPAQDNAEFQPKLVSALRAKGLV